MFVFVLFLFIYLYNGISFVLPNKCIFLDTMKNNTQLINNCISSKYAYKDVFGKIILSNNQGYFRAFFDSTNGNILILTINENINQPYINKNPPVNVPATAFSLFPYFNSTKHYELPSFFNSALKVSTNGIEIVSIKTGKQLWKGNSGLCNIPQLIMQFDRNLVLYCGIDKNKNPIIPKWNSNTPCHGKQPSYWCGNFG